MSEPGSGGSVRVGKPYRGCKMFKKILIAVDGSDCSDRAVEVAADLALHYAAKVIVLHVTESIGSSRLPTGFEQIERIEHVHITENDLLMGVAHQIVERAAVRCLELGVEHVDRQVLAGNPRAVIVQVAKAEGVELIVMGRRGLGRIADMLLGSVSHRVTQTAECACLTVH
ncbi:MAG: universal stress protein [Gammaproteobacteria bacterium]|nr:universal stress protein [Gammaproteobacteria bacterium]